MTVLFGNQEECYLPWANGYRLGSVRWNREIINHEINVGIMYPELTHPTLPFEHLSLSTEPKNLSESVRAGRLTIPILWKSTNDQVIITEGYPQTISFQQGTMAQIIEIQWAANHEHFSDTGILEFESIDLENTHVDFIGYRNPRSHPEVHLWNNNSRILRIPRDFQTEIWNQMNRWKKGNDTLRNTRITLELEDGTTIRGDYQIDRSMFEFEFSMPEWIKLLQDGTEEDYTHKVTLRITNRNHTRSFTVSDIEIDLHEVFHKIPMLDGWFGVDSVHYTEALDGTEELDLDFQLEEVGRFDMNLIRYRITTNFNDAKVLLAGDIINNEIRRDDDRTLSKKIALPPLPDAFGQYEMTITPELRHGDTDRWIALTNFSNHISLDVEYPRQPNFTWGTQETNWRTLMRAGNLNNSTVHNELTKLPAFPEDNGMKTQLFFRENSRRLDVIPITCEEFIDPEEWITEWVILNPFSRYKYPEESTEFSLYEARQRMIVASIFIPNSQSKDWVITKPATYDTRNNHTSEYDFMNGRYGVNTAIHACEKTGLHLLIFAPENSLEWDDEDMTYQNLVELLNGSEINDFDFDYGFVEIIPEED